MNTDSFTLQELADLTGVAVRTIRSYIGKKLMPGSGTRGRGARYGTHHLDRIRAIQVLKRDHSLEKIRDIFLSRGPETIREIISGKPPHDPERKRNIQEILKVQGKDFEDSSERASSNDLLYSAPVDLLYFVLERISNIKKIARETEVEHWVHYKITPHFEISVKGEYGELQLERLARIADYLRSELMGAWEPDKRE